MHNKGEPENKLLQRIIDRIRRDGPITFADFMGMALYEPELGYYVREETEIGRAGDFYTSAHLHPVFGGIMARQVEEMWRICDRPAKWVVVEQGGGRGLFAADFLNETRDRFPELYAALEYRIIELNPSLKARQQQLVENHGDRVHWFDGLGEMKPFTGVHFSNELPDALPVHLVEMGEDGLQEIFVGGEDGRLVEVPAPPSTPKIEAYLDRYSVRLPERYRTEVHLAAGVWMEEVAEKLERGYVIAVDYGFNTADYYSEDRSTGTLICYHKHKTNEEPLERVGHQDITAHVHFTDLVRVGEDHGLRPICFVPQGAFLISLGVDEIITERFSKLKESDYLVEMTRIKSLLMPDAMGESHKVLIQGKDVPEQLLKGCGMRNRLGYLTARD